MRIITLLLLSALLFSQQSLAQRGGPPPAEQKLDLASAQAAMAAALAESAATENVAIAIVDANGDLLLFSRKDGAPSRAVTTAQGKARASVMFGMTSREVQASVQAGEPLTAMITSPPAGAWELTLAQGAVPIFRNGELVGAIGVGGVAPSRDEEIAQAGVDTIE